MPSLFFTIDIGQHGPISLWFNVCGSDETVLFPQRAHKDGIDGALMLTRLLSNPNDTYFTSERK